MIVKGEFGTHQFPPDTECGRCDNRAVGVWVKETRRGNRPEPLCAMHRNQIKKANKATWENTEFRRFVDDD